MVSNLFEKLGITHSVLFDKDNDHDIHKIVNDFILSKKNKYTKNILTFDSDFEKFLEIDAAYRKDLKPLNVLKNLKDSKVSTKKIEELCHMFDKLCAL